MIGEEKRLATEQNINQKRRELARRLKTEIVRESAVPVCKITLMTDACTIFDSKVGGLPYLPRGGRLPVGSGGNPLPLLAQVNCEELPAMPDFPRRGMLQFFMSDGDFDREDYQNPTEQGNWRVVYYPAIDNSVEAGEAAALIQKMGAGKNGIAKGEYRMNFTLAAEGLTVEDFRFERAFLRRWNEIFPDEKPESMYGLRNVPNSIFENDGAGEYGQHKIGGYPYFTQYDPRRDETYDTLLFQLDTDPHNDVYVMYGDSGVINFFINREALKKLDFSDVLWNGDCC